MTGRRPWIGIFLAALVAVLVVPAIALAAWTKTGPGYGYSKAQTMSSGNAPTASVSGRNVTVSWTASSGAAVPVDGYKVRRYADGGGVQTIGANCTGTIAALTCTENNVASGDWRYTVAPVHQGWQGTESTQSAKTTVGAPSMSLSPGSVSSLPAALSGSISNFKSGQTVTFRLDDPSTGTVLTGSISPTPVQTNGNATVNVTIPNGTSNGSHTVYAIGSNGDTASAAVTVAVPQTISTSAWNLRDASAGGAESDQSDATAFASDSRTVTTGNAPTSFSTSNYLVFDYNAPLASSSTVTGSPTFDFRFAAQGPPRTACFYLDVRRASTDAVLATHGSAANPVGCVSGTTLQSFSTALPEVSSAAIANDLRVRVYVQQDKSKSIDVDRATVSGTGSQGSFSLFERSFHDRADGTDTDLSWPLAGVGNTVYTTLSNLLGSLLPARYMKLTFPSYIPAGNTVNNGNFVFRYRSNGGGTSCYYFEVLQGSTVIGTHGSSGSPVSCNSSSTNYVTDTTALPEINSAAKANGAIVKVYERNSGLAKVDTDRAELQINFVP
jgi:hypothetical protein